jgi:DNA-binding NarL/FixJ family response regulator
MVLVTDKEGKELKRYMNYVTDVVLFDATFWQDVSPRKIGYLLKSFPDKNIAVFNLSYLRPEKAALFVRYGVKSYFDLSGSGSFWKGLKTVLRGRRYITPSVWRALEDLPDGMPEVRLDMTRRMEEVKQLICKGMRTKEIADMLGLSVRTVDIHKSALFAAYGVNSSIALFRQCFMLGEVVASNKWKTGGEQVRS